MNYWRLWNLKIPTNYIPLLIFPLMKIIFKTLTLHYCTDEGRDWGIMWVYFEFWEILGSIVVVVIRILRFEFDCAFDFYQSYCTKNSLVHSSTHIWLHSALWWLQNVQKYTGKCFFSDCSEEKKMFILAFDVIIVLQLLFTHAFLVHCAIESCHIPMPLSHALYFPDLILRFSDGMRSRSPVLSSQGEREQLWKNKIASIADYAKNMHISVRKFRGPTNLFSF